MSLSLYQVSIPIFVRNLSILSTLLKQGEDYANEKHIPLTQLLGTRLAPDMAALAFQIQRVSDSSKGFAVRVGGVSNIAMPDNETTFPELHERIQKTIDFLNQVDSKAINGKETEGILLKTGTGDRKFTGETYLLHHVYPNFFFHLTTAYALLRHAGVPVGKNDYLGPVVYG